MVAFAQKYEAGERSSKYQSARGNSIINGVAQWRKR